MRETLREAAAGQTLILLRYFAVTKIKISSAGDDDDHSYYHYYHHC